jgi:hypothetical protein
MSYLLAAALVAALVFWGAGARTWLRRAGWRIASGGFGIGALAAAAFVTLRGGWVEGLLLALIGLLLSLSARWPRPATPAPQADGGMSLAEARSVLGVGEDASASEIQTAYARLMRLVHPDRGGATGLAVQLNRARDRLLGR